MENINYSINTIKGLRNIARERGLQGYSKLKKAELIEHIKNPPIIYTRAQLTQQAKDKGLKRYSTLKKAELIRILRPSVLDQDIDTEMVNVPFLTPTKYTPSQTPTPAPTPPNTIKDLIDYLDNVKEIPKSVSPRVKKLKKEVKSIYSQMKKFEVRESNSALRRFVRVYTINGIEGFDPLSFMQYACQNIINVLRNKRRTKVKLILKCYMEWLRTNEIKPTDFHSEIEVNLDGTDEKELINMMMERILENIARF